MLNLDSHILIYFCAGQLTTAEEKLISREDLCISDIVLWEIAKLVQLKRITLDLNSKEFREIRNALKILPITLEIAHISTTLDFKADPADEIIAATSIVENVPLLTRDKKILKSKMVPFV
jgi:PIN domain nuclease of toxin-antitoxin system